MEADIQAKVPSIMHNLTTRLIGWFCPHQTIQFAQPVMCLTFPPNGVDSHEEAWRVIVGMLTTVDERTSVLPCSMPSAGDSVPSDWLLPNSKQKIQAAHFKRMTWRIHAIQYTQRTVESCDSFRATCVAGKAHMLGCDDDNFGVAYLSLIYLSLALPLSSK